MRGLVATSVALGLWAAPGHAAEPLVKKAKPAPQTVAAPAPAFTWTGCYLGGHVGGGWGRKELANFTGFELANSAPLFDNLPTLSQPISGFLGGAQAGCKYEFARNWVIGIDGDFSSALISGSTALSPFVTHPGVGIPTTVQAKTDWLASVTANFGYSFNRALFYVKGGAAWAHDKYGFSAIPAVGIAPADFEATETRNGWTVGAGIEYLFSKNVSAKIEYDYYNFGDRKVPFVDQFPSAAPSFGDVSIKQNIHAIKFGLNYYFWNPTSIAETPAPTAAPLVTKAPTANATSPPDPSGITWAQTFASEVRYFSWQSNRGIPNNTTVLGPPFQPLMSAGSGSELYIPYATQLVGQTNDFKIELLGRGGWVDARQTTTGLTGQVQTATDTVGSATVTYLGFQGFQPFAALALNLPTGLAALPQTAVNARMDPDLVDIATFGEGLNIGPTLGFNLPITNSLLVTLSVGYTKRGKYDRETPFTPTASGPGGSTKIDPGDVLTGTVSVGYQIGQLTTKLTGTVSQEGTTFTDGVPFVRPGRTYLAAGTWAYTWPGDNAGVTTLSASASHTNRNEVLFVFPGAPTSLIKEPFDTNSNLYRVGLEHLFGFGQVAFGPLGSVLVRDANGYDPTTIQFVPAKVRWSAGAQAKYAPSEILTFNARVERVWIHENESPALPDGLEKTSVFLGGPLPGFAVPMISSTGWQFMFGATASF